MSAGDIYKATATFVMPEATIAQWVWHYIQEVGDDVDLQVLADNIRSNVGQAMNEIEDHIIDTVVGDTLELALYDPVLGQFDTVAVSDLSGADGENAVDEMLPHQDAGVVKFFTEVARSIGKKFIFGLVETTQSGSIFIGAVVTAMAAFAAIFDADIAAGGELFRPGNFDVLLEVFRGWNGTVEANAVTGSQRRRRPGIGI